MRIGVLLSVAASLALTLLSVESAHAGRQADYVPVYQGLLQHGDTPDAAPDGAFAALRDKIIVLLPSANFSTYVEIWREFYENGPPQPWVSENNLEVARQASDTHLFADRVMVAAAFRVVGKVTHRATPDAGGVA